VSLRARLLLVVTALAATGLLIANVATYAALRSFLVDRVDRSLAANSDVLERALERRGFVRSVEMEQLTALTPGVFVQLRAPDGSVAGSGVDARGESTPALPELPDDLPAAAAGGARNLTVAGSDDGADFRVRVEALPAGWTLVVAAPLDDVEATLRRLALIAALVSLAVVAAIVALGLTLVRVGLRPLTRIEDTAAAIAGGDLGRRVEEADTRTEIGRLGLALNTMLGHIERAFAERSASEERLRRFVADASHELRTPLAAVQAYAELFERGARERPEDLERAMAGIQREAERMALLVDDLLLLARLDQGRPLERRSVDLAELAVEACDAARAVEPSRPLTLDAAEPLTVAGDPARLRQVVDNLLANVRAHTPPGTPAAVRVVRRDTQAVVEVEDQGPGLEPEQAARVFERFYRADASRARGAGGSGLGLAIVAAIADAHGGAASVTSEPERGTAFRVVLPLAGDEAPPAGSRELEAAAAGP
jgi:two-component system, OmpR family, sensor kinase